MNLRTKEQAIDTLDGTIMELFYEWIKINFDVEIVQDSSELRDLLKSHISRLRIADIEGIEEWAESMKFKKNPEHEEKSCQWERNGLHIGEVAAKNINQTLALLLSWLAEQKKNI